MAELSRELRSDAPRDVALASRVCRVKQAEVATCGGEDGVGKTTTTAALGAALADLDDRVILVDADPQGSFSDST